jgi:D-alanyl-D-alanine carboxypeptidase
MKTFIIVIAAALAVSCTKLPIDKPDTIQDVSYSNHPKHSLYQTSLEDYKNNTGSPGSIMLIKRNTENLWIGSTGFANLEYKTPMLTNQQFRTGSITKMFTAVIILQLVNEGKLTLDSKLSNYIPSLAEYIDKNHEISIRYLLSHLSGIYDPSNESLAYQSDILNHPQIMAAMSVEEKMKKYVARKKLKFEPGSAYAYSNTNYWLLGAIAEELTGKKLETLFRERIYIPLGMNNTYLQVKDDRNVARGYADLYSNGQLIDVTIFDRAEGDSEADGGLISTAEDLYKFMNGLFSTQLLPAAMVEEMKRKQLASCNTPECEYGLGIEIWRTKAGLAYGHNGALLGNEANALYYPDKNAVTVLYKNNGNGSTKDFLEELVNRQ